MEKSKQMIKELWPWFWTWRRLLNESASLKSGLGRRTSASPEKYCKYCAVTLSTRGVCNSKDVRQSRSRPSRLSCQGPSGVPCFHVCLKLSVTDSVKEGKRKMIASCGFPESELSQFSKEEGVSDLGR